jgi:histone-lysine N-methyltransferase SETMAR
MKGIVHHEFVPPNTAVNTDFNCDILRCWRQNVQQKRPELRRNHNWLFHQDNAPTHMSLKTKEFVTNNNKVIVNHPPYSLDVVPCDFALFPKLEMKLKGRCFETVSDIQGDSQVVLDSIEKNDFHSAFEAWKKMMGSLYTFPRDYHEGDGSQN